MIDNKEEDKKQTENVKTNRKPWQFQPGNNANPYGRPRKKDTFSDCLREYLDGEITTENGEQLTRMQIAVRAMYKKALNDGSMMKEMLDRGFGKVAQRIESVRKDSFDDMSIGEIEEYLVSNGIDPKSIK